MKAKLIKPIFVIWIAAVALGYGTLLNYASAPAPVMSGPTKFPLQSGLGLNPTGLTMVAFFHPQCPCSKATVSELQSILNRSSFFAEQGKPDLKVYAVIAKPKGTSASFTHTALVSSLGSTKGIEIVIDKDDRDGRLFSAAASGQILLFDSSGNKLFDGGITAERGHEGESTGGEALIELIGGHKVAIEQTPVFGCALESSR